jgi:hypothetical protein
MIDGKTVAEVHQVVNLWDRLAEFLEQSFEVFLDALLAVEANAVMKRSFAAGAALCVNAVGFGFSHPFCRGRLHKGLSRLT